MIFAEDSNNDQSEFDTIVGCIEDIVIGEKFQDLQVQSILNAITRIKGVKKKFMFVNLSNPIYIFYLCYFWNIRNLWLDQTARSLMRIRKKTNWFTWTFFRWKWNKYIWYRIAEKFSRYALSLSHCYLYTKGYTKAVEEFIEEELEKRIPEFNMRTFIQGISFILFIY